MKERIVQLDLDAIREVSKRRCQLAGFTFAKSMPQRTAEECLLRPADEIVNRTHALLLLILFVCDSEEGSSTAEILEDLDRYRLWSHLTVGETDVFRLDRMLASDEYADVIGWQMENVWPLAWYLGFETGPRIDGVMIHDEINDILGFFFQREGQGGRRELATFSPRCLEAVVQLEDLFCCVHNAARSAQIELGQQQGLLSKFRHRSTVPADFDPMSGGGVIQERRHALSWMLSPGIAWNETDLGT